MFEQYVEAAMRHARYEVIDDSEPYYGEVEALEGVRATGNTQEECEAELAEVIAGWVGVRTRLRLAVPPVDRAEPVSSGWAAPA